MRWLVMAFVMLPLMAQAAGGAWSATANGPLLANRGSWQRAQPLTPPADIGGEVSVINWRYQLSRPAPSGLQVRLCGEQRCTSLEGQAAPRAGWHI